jgi:hypothetical protein
MKKTLILLLAALAALACRETQDTRYFAPDVEFAEAEYAAASESGGADLTLRLSRPAPIAFQIGLNFSGSLREDVQFQVSSHTLDIAAGATEAKVHIALVDDEIWDEKSWIDVAIAPGDRYTINPSGNCTARVNVSKAVVLSTLRFAAQAGPVVTNPYRAETLHFEVTADRPPKADLAVSLDLGGLVPGLDCLIDGGTASRFTFPAGTDKASFDLSILFKDESGCDRHASLALVQEKGVYAVASDGASVDIHLSDPSVDFSPLFKSAALQGGDGYQVRQAFLGADGAWSGNTTADMGVSSTGSNYLRTFRNMYDHPSFNCPANASVSQMFRLSDLFPNYLYPNETAILDYGNDQGHREFSPADSLLRFVLDPGETKKGTIHLGSPKTFVAFIGSYAAWQDKSSGENAWAKDSRANKGDIFASTHPAITGQISVTLERLEGTFDFTNSTEPILVTAWFRSDSDQFMKADEAHDKTPAETYAVSQEDGLWKVSYRFWPR